MSELIEYLISQTLNNKIDTELLVKEITDESNIVTPVLGVTYSTGSTKFKIEFESALIGNNKNDYLLPIVQNHTGDPTLFNPKIVSMLEGESKYINFHDINYNIAVKPNLFPKRHMAQGELTKVEWFADTGLINKVLEVNISYIRDGFGFASERTTIRKWVMNNGGFHPDEKVTTKDYTINPIDQIVEGKRRRGNIVNDIQLPTLAFLVEVLSGPPDNLTQTEILLMGRDFMDRFDDEFKKFIDNSSTVTDDQDPDFGKKKVVVAFETASTTTDGWLLLNPLQLDPTGSTSILDYLVAQFSI